MDEETRQAAISAACGGYEALVESRIRVAALALDRAHTILAAIPADTGGWQSEASAAYLDEIRRLRSQTEQLCRLIEKLSHALIVVRSQVRQQADIAQHALAAAGAL